MRIISASTFKARCLRLLDEVQFKRESILITKYGRPIAKTVPVNSDADDIYGFLAGKGRIKGNLV